MTGQNSPSPSILRQNLEKHPVKLGDTQLEVLSAPGLPDWELSSPSARLIAENVRFRPTDRVLLFGCHQGALAAYLARILPPSQIFLSDNNLTALEVTRLALSANHVTGVNLLTGIDLPSEYDQKLDVVIIQIPKGRLLARRWLVQAFNALTLDGSFYIVGSNHAGIQSAIKDAQDLMGPGRILAYKKGNRLAHILKKLGKRSSPDWMNAAGIAPHTWVEFSITLSDRSFAIHSLPGIFSFDHLDEGTEMLLGAVQIPQGAVVLDAGCGYGIIGLYAALQGAGKVHWIDNNLLAVAACRETLSMNDINDSGVIAGDLLNPLFPNQYDLILSNPPFHSGQAVDYQVAEILIENSFRALKPNGRLTIVANRFIRYDRLIREIYGNISIVAESGKFHVLSGLKSS
jgi:16S rRNA (guanine1207-N2)-methyltransferase